jgi:hypothetical protein
MAFVSQSDKAKLAPAIKAICKKYNVKASIAVRYNSTLVLNIKAGPIDFIGNYNEINSKKFRPSHLQFQPATGNIEVNHHWFHDHFDGIAKDFLTEIIPAMKGPDFFDNSDIQTDYFNCSHYFAVKVGKWDKPYELIAE